LLLSQRNRHFRFGFSLFRLWQILHKRLRYLNNKIVGLCSW
jgi:hypothetical protein